MVLPIFTHCCMHSPLYVPAGFMVLQVNVGGVRADSLHTWLGRAFVLKYFGSPWRQLDITPSAQSKIEILTVRRHEIIDFIIIGNALNVLRMDLSCFGLRWTVDRAMEKVPVQVIRIFTYQWIDLEFRVLGRLFF